MTLSAAGAVETLGGQIGVVEVRIQVFGFRIEIVDWRVLVLGFRILIFDELTLLTVDRRIVIGRIITENLKKKFYFEKINFSVPKPLLTLTISTKFFEKGGV
jgi:hypothetical protein